MTLSLPTSEELGLYLGADVTEDSAELGRSLATAEAIVDDFITSAWRDVPQAIYAQAVLDTAANIWQRKNNINGAAQYTFDGGGYPAPLANNPLQKSIPLLRPYVTGF